MIRIAICDDSLIDIEIMQAFLKDYYKSKNYYCEIETYTSGETLIETYRSSGNKYHLLFLDIYMKQMNGMETANLIRKYDDNVKIIFCTVSQEHAVDSYDVFAYGYLVKPFDVEKMKHLLDKFTESVSGKEVSFLCVKSEYADRLINRRDIVYIESKDKVLYIHTKENEVIKTYGKMSNIQEQIDDSTFLRCHQSYIVNMNEINGIEDGDFTTTINETVPIRKKDFSKIRKYYNLFLIQQEEHTK